VVGAFPLEAPLVTTSGAGELSSRSFLVTRVARSPWEASLELEASLKSREPAVAPAPVPAAGTVAYMFNTSLGLEGVRAAGSGGSNNPARWGLFCCFHHDLARTLLAGRVRGRAGGSVVSRRDIFGSRRQGRGSPSWSNFPSWHGIDLRCSNRAGNSIRGHLRADRLLRPSFARHKLQPRGVAVVFNATRVAANLIPARPLVA
jgi:hypothetical protein